MEVELDTLQLLTAWTWSEDFDLQEQFSDLSDALEPFGFQQVGEDTNLLLRCCAAVTTGEASPDALIDLNGADVRERFQEITNGILGAIDFIRANVHVESLKNLPFNTLLVPLTVFFAVPEGTSVRVSTVQRAELLRWFWRSCFSRRYSSGVLRNLRTDIEEAGKLRMGASSALSAVQATISPDFFIENTFNVGSVNTKSFVLLLAQQLPLSFVSGSPVSLASVLKDYNRNEFHHCYPQAFLRSLNTGPISPLANLAFMSSIDNKTLGGSAPSVYRGKMNADAIDRILDHAVCPHSLFDDDYEGFLETRSKSLAAEAERLMA